MIYLYCVLTACYLLFNTILALVCKDVSERHTGALWWVLMILFGMPIVVVTAVILIPYEVLMDGREKHGEK